MLIKINQFFRLKNVSFEILDADDAIFVQQGGHVRKLKSAPTYLIPGVSWGGWSVISLFTCSREHLIIDRRSVRAVLNVTDPPMALRVLGTKIIWSAATHVWPHGLQMNITLNTYRTYYTQIQVWFAFKNKYTFMELTISYLVMTNKTQVVPL